MTICYQWIFILNGPKCTNLTIYLVKNTIAYVKSTFSRNGVPDIFFTDNGCQFNSQEFKEFATEYGFTYRTSSPIYPQSNGQAERTVQTVKTLLKKASDPYKALLDYATQKCRIQDYRQRKYSSDEDCGHYYRLPHRYLTHTTGRVFVKSSSKGNTSRNITTINIQNRVIYWF